MLFIPLWIIFGDVARSLADFGDDPVIVNVAKRRVLKNRWQPWGLTGATN